MLFHFFVFTKIYFYLYSDLAFLWIDCLKVSCMLVFVGGSSSVRNEVISCLKFAEAECPPLMWRHSHGQSDVRRRNLGLRRKNLTGISAHLWLNVFRVSLYFRLKTLLFFGSALCFAWRSASSDPSASYPELWRGQALTRDQLTTYQGYSRECLVILWLCSRCLIGPFADTSWEVIIAVAVCLLASKCLCNSQFDLWQRRHRVTSWGVLSLHFEVDQSFSFLNFNLCYLSGLLAVKDCYPPPPFLPSLPPHPDPRAMPSSLVPTDVRK